MVQHPVDESGRARQHNRAPPHADRSPLSTRSASDNRFWRLPSAARLLYVSSLLLVLMNRTRLVAVYGCPTSVPAKQLETTQSDVSSGWRYAIESCLTTKRAAGGGRKNEASSCPKQKVFGFDLKTQKLKTMAAGSSPLLSSM